MSDIVKYKLPDINDIYSDKVALAKQNDLNVILNHPPKPEWVKDHPVAKKVKYIPIERVEYLLTSIFTKWSVEVKQIQLIANSVVVTIRLYFRNPITGEMEYQDGIGASPLQTDQGASATDWEKIKSDAVMKSAPAAESFAVKDAAEKIGNLFGKDLNRADKIMYDSLLGKFDESKEDIIKLKKQLIDILDKREDKVALKRDLRGLENENKVNIELLKEWIEKYK